MSIIQQCFKQFFPRRRGEPVNRPGRLGREGAEVAFEHTPHQFFQLFGPGRIEEGHGGKTGSRSMRIRQIGQEHGFPGDTEL